MKCKACHKGIPRLAPELVSTGCKAPGDKKCPICDTIHNGATGQTLKEWGSEAEERVSKIRQNLLSDPEYWQPDLWEV